MKNGEEKDGLTYWHMVGGFEIVRTKDGQIFQYGRMFYGNWKLYSADKVMQFKSEDELITYLKAL